MSQAKTLLSFFLPVLGFPFFVAIRRNDGSLNLNGVNVKGIVLSLGKNQMSSRQFFQLSLAPRPFSLSHEMRFRKIKYFPAASGMQIEVFQSAQIYIDALSLSRRTVFLSHLSSHFYRHRNPFP